MWYREGTFENDAVLRALEEYIGKGGYGREVGRYASSRCGHPVLPLGMQTILSGSLLLKEKLNEMNIPMLILDGDGIDRRNSHDGQIKTRLEAFLEMLENENGTEVDGEKSSAGRLTEEEQERAC